MANPTTNYGFVLPTSTDLVTDLPADFDVALQGVDTRLKALQPGTTLGDLFYASATANTNTRLGIGSTSQVLTVTGGVPTWATPTSSTESFALLNAGGTALTGATTITVSGLSGYNNLHIIIETASSVNASSSMTFKFNSSATNHTYFSNLVIANSSYSSSVFDNNYGSNGGSVNFGKMSSSASSVVVGYIKVYGANTTAVKPFHYSSGGSTSSGVSQESYNGGGYFNAAAVISTFSLISSTGNFDSGTIYIYGSVA
jgi:hypothetical protein